MFPASRPCFFLIAAPALAWSAAAVLVSCAHSPEEGSATETVAEAPAGPATVVLLDDVLAPKILVRQQASHRDPASSIILAEIMVENRTFEWLELECRTLFRDDQGSTLETSPWKAVRLDPACRVVYAAPTLKTGTTRYITQIRLAPKS
ncbi:MAG: hypothetical protein SFU85_11005 [Candidatus Methylacidiphilales bacterium]|nr:hypothetical protein [Candidatus Methylacidiphilales bacterium]